MEAAARVTFPNTGPDAGPSPNYRAAITPKALGADRLRHGPQLGERLEQRADPVAKLS